MKRHVRAQAMVEMALITPLIILFVLGITDGGYYVYTYSELENAARRGSEWAYKSPPTTPDQSDDNTTDKCALLIKQDVLQRVFLSDLGLDDILISYPGTQQRDIGVPIEVQITYTGHWLTPLGRQVFGPDIPFSFASRRTIVNVGPPGDMNDGCS